MHFIFIKFLCNIIFSTHGGTLFSFSSPICLYLTNVIIFHSFVFVVCVCFPSRNNGTSSHHQLQRASHHLRDQRGCSKQGTMCRWSSLLGHNPSLPSSQFQIQWNHCGALKGQASSPLRLTTHLPRRQSRT